MKEREPDDSAGPAPILPLRGGDRVRVRDLVEQIVDEAMAGDGDALGVRVVVDVPATIAVDADRLALRRVLSALVARALRGARLGCGPCRPDVLVTGVVCAEGLEIEVAASGAALDPADAAALGRRGHAPDRSRGRAGAWVSELIREAALVGGELTAVDCPEGGAAVTLRLPLRRTALRRAA